jgi:hypothetical protein
MEIEYGVNWRNSIRFGWDYLMDNLLGTTFEYHVTDKNELDYLLDNELIRNRTNTGYHGYSISKTHLIENDSILNINTYLRPKNNIYEKHILNYKNFNI